MKARKRSRHATPDWIPLAKQRGISVTSSVMQFEYAGPTVKLLEVCRLRNTPIITFINKLDREAESTLTLIEVPASVCSRPSSLVRCSG